MLKLLYSDTSVFNNDTLLEAAMKRLPPHRRKKAVSLKKRNAGNLSVGAWITLCGGLKSLGADIDSLIFDKHPNGKPYIKNSDIHFSLSHSGTFAVCAISDSDVGADIEEITEFNPRLAKRYFNKTEYDHIFSKSTPEEQRNEFFRIWTLKESYVKFTGKGISGFPDSTLILNQEPHLLNDVHGLNFLEFDLPSYKISVCGYNLPKETVPERINLIHQLINF
ncbi:MAG: 4'-phosphopantetheinyl transferase superfamily protein [Clostridia bacterium]|nr:4'-phosphopantetheinyl transferase superfamily protein [Clostridia bacterium]